MIKTLYPMFRKWSEKGSVYIVSDTHFADDDCKYMDENWPEPEEYVKECFKKVSKNDTLIHLGDVGDPKYMAGLKCHKVLICGNHDDGPSKYEPYFDEIYTGPLMIAEKILLSHEPVDIDWAFNIHGHDHSKEHKGDDFHMNCAANVIGYRCVSLQDIIKSGVLKNVDSLHRKTIDNAAIKKSEKAADNVDKCIRKTPVWKDADGKFESFVAEIPEGEIIYPGRCAKTFGMDVVDAYLYLEGFEKRYGLTSVLSVRCPECGRHEWLFNSLFDIPETYLVCPECGTHIPCGNIHADALVVYRKDKKQAPGTSPVPPADDDPLLGGMELGNLLFGHSRGEYPVARDGMQDMFVEFLDAIGMDGYGWADEDSPMKKYEADYGYENEMFAIRPYYWGDDDEYYDLPNFEYKPENIEIRWYKYPFRDAYSNVELTQKELKRIIDKCQEFILRSVHRH